MQPNSYLHITREKAFSIHTNAFSLCFHSIRNQLEFLVLRKDNCGGFFFVLSKRNVARASCHHKASVKKGISNISPVKNSVLYREHVLE